ncbi:MAG TPA: hypothetical protein EYQ50_29155 [Verrucomicrobiales bacterium]|nr:hypothetical protein [Verrucomicrobiales bacterium]
MNKPMSSTITYPKYGESSHPTPFSFLTFYASDEPTIRYVGKFETLIVSLATKSGWQTAQNNVGQQIMTLEESFETNAKARLVLSKILQETTIPYDPEPPEYIPVELRRIFLEFVNNDEIWTKGDRIRIPVHFFNLVSIFRNWFLDKTTTGKYPKGRGAPGDLATLRLQLIGSGTEFCHSAPPEWMRRVRFIMEMENGQYIGVDRIGSHSPHNSQCEQSHR